MPTKPTSTHSVESLEHTAEELAKYAEEIRHVAERMKLLGIETLEITNNDQRARSIDYADKFAAAARGSLREAMNSKLVTPPPNNGPPKRVRRRPKNSE